MKKLIDIQTELKAPKNQYNGFGKYKYRSCEDILEGLKPLLKKHSCVLSISDDITVISDRIYVKATATIFDGKDSISVTSFAREPMSKKGMDEAQVTGSTSSYARKYALNGLFLIDDTKDSDAMPSDQTSKQAANKPTVKDNLTVQNNEYRLKENLRKQLEAELIRTGRDRAKMKKHFKVEHIYEMTEKQQAEAMRLMSKEPDDEYNKAMKNILKTNSLDGLEVLNQVIEEKFANDRKKMDELKVLIGKKITKITEDM